jgi:signal transduction histidine kinase
LRVSKLGKDIEVGTLEVVASIDAIYRQVASSALKIVLGNGLKTFLVSMFMLYLFRRVVTRRLDTLASKVRALAPLSFGFNAVADTANTKGDELDELGQILADTTHRLQQALQDRETALRLGHEAERANTLEQANATLEQLGAIGREITGNLQATAIMAALDRHVNALLDANTFVIFRLEADGSTLRMAFGIEAAQALALVQIQMSNPTSQTARCAREQREFVREVEPGHGNALIGALENLSMMFAPLLVGERLLGVMTIQSVKAHAYGEREVAVFRTLCAYGAIALANAESQAQLIQAEKMASLGQLVASVAHEINTPIAAVKSSGETLADALQHIQATTAEFGTLDLETRLLFARLMEHSMRPAVALSSRDARNATREVTRQLLEAGVADAEHKARVMVQLSAQSVVQDYLPLLNHARSDFILNRAEDSATMIKGIANINMAVERVSKIVFALKSFSRVDNSGQKQWASLVEGLETVLTIYNNQIKQGTELVRHFEAIPHILCLPDELNQVWTNLIHNALQAMKNQGTLTLDVHRRGSEVVVSVTDTGCGIPEANRSRIFDPFFTTKPTGEGSGLGLDIVKKIVEKHQGRIEVQSEVDVGSTFLVYLPLEVAPEIA